MQWNSKWKTEMKANREIDNIKKWEKTEHWKFASEMMDDKSGWEKPFLHSSIKELDSILWWWVPVGWTVTRITAYTLTQVNQSLHTSASNLLKQWKKILFINLGLPTEMVLQSINSNLSEKHLNDIRKWQGPRDIWDYLNRDTQKQKIVI